MDNTLSEILSQIPALIEVDIDDLEEICKKAKLKKFTGNSYVFHQGDEGDNFYVIKSGKVEVTKRINNIEKQVAVLYPDNFFGEMALISEEPRNASIRCLDDCEFFVFNKKDFYEFLYL